MSNVSSSPFEEEFLKASSHEDPDKHWIGQSLGIPSRDEVAETIGVTATEGTSPYPARADHNHMIDTGLLTEFAEFNPAGNTDATGLAPLALWLSLPINGEVPDWATVAVVQLNLTGIFVVTAAPTTYQLDLTLSGGAIAGQTDFIAFPAINERQNISFTVRDSSGFNTGAGQFIRVFAGGSTGGGIMRADANSRASALITFRP